MVGSEHTHSFIEQIPSSPPKGYWTVEIRGWCCTRQCPPICSSSQPLDQDKEDEVIAKDIPVKEGMAASVQNKSTEFGDQVFLLQSDRVLSTAKFDQNLDTASVAIKARVHVPEVQGGGAEMEQCSAGKLPETEEIREGMPMQKPSSRCL
ncbi:unnamed protein product [Sphagnum compactum]